MDNLIVTSPAFVEGDWLPFDCTDFGKNNSPQLDLENISDKAVSLAVVMNDMDHPFVENFNHWLIWNIPVMDSIPACIPEGDVVFDLECANQGVAWGKHCYRGPRPAFKKTHSYMFTVYVLDCMLEIPADSTKEEFFISSEGHIIQQASITGKYQKGHK